MSAAHDYGLDDDYEWPRPPAGGWTADDLNRLKLTVPFAIDVDLTSVNRRG